MRIFVDSDVIISSLLSTQGAAYLLLHFPQIERVISSLSYKELKIVVQRLHIPVLKLNRLIKNQCSMFDVKKNSTHFSQAYREYVTDEHDAHIIAAAHKAQVPYLISYNLKHFKVDLIKEKLDILVMTPALFVQYLRSN